MENQLNHNIHLTINNFPETNITTSQWSLFGKIEPERVAVRFEDKEYVTVLDSPPYFEIWSLDEQGELDKILRIIRSVRPEPKVSAQVAAMRWNAQMRDKDR